jgi:threonine dehydratase
MENKLHRTTPLIYSHKLSLLYDAIIFLKAENIQVTNSFKIRGASNFCAKHIDKFGLPKGFCTHSSGNHGKALAYVCSQLGVTCKIVVPRNAPLIKIDAMRSLGAEIVFCEPDTHSRLAEVKTIEDQGFCQVPPYDHKWIMGGQATVAEEILQQCPDLDGIVCPIGGGGLSGGISSVLENSGKKLIGAEPFYADDAYKSFKNGHLEENSRFDSVADGLRANLGKVNFEQLKKCDFFRIERCTEEDINNSARYALLEEKLMIEKSSATVLAILPTIAAELKNKTWVLVLSGGNVDPITLLE